MFKHIYMEGVTSENTFFASVIFFLSVLMSDDGGLRS